MRVCAQCHRVIETGASALVSAPLCDDGAVVGAEDRLVVCSVRCAEDVREPVLAWVFLARTQHERERAHG